MPKQLYKIIAFHGGLATGPDPRDILDGQLSDAVDVMVDNVGKIRMIGGPVVHKAEAHVQTGYGGDIKAGYGLFYFSHDYGGAERMSVFSGSHTGADHSTIMTDSAAKFITDALIGGTIYNDTDGSSGVITDNDATTVTVSSLSGGTDDSWDDSNDDAYHIEMPLTGDNYLALWDDDDGEVWIYSEAVDDAGATGWDDNSNDADSGPIIVGAGTPVFHIADGSLRVADATFTQTTKWYGYIKRTYWPGLTDGESVEGWYSYDNTIAKSLVGDGATSDVFRYNDSAGAWPTISAPAMSTAGTVGMVVGGYRYAAGGMRGFKDYYKTMIYDHNQESLPMRLSGLNTQMDDIWENAKKRFKVHVHTGGGDFYNKRVTGAKIYYRSVDSASKPYGDMYLLLECDFRHGVRRNSTDVYEPWVTVSTNIVAHNYIEFTSWPKTEVYGSRSGYTQDLHSIDAKYKTAVVANRRTYIGNVQFTDKGGTVVTKGDAVIKSPVNAFDVFPATNILEATVNDGDEIIKLEVYADRLLQFKKHKLEIINISQAVEFLEETFHHKGVGHQAAVCKTDFGIAWVNEFGCYLFDGQKVNDLLEKGGIQVIKESEWFNWLTAGKDGTGASLNPMIGYVPKKRQLIFLDDITSTGDGSIYLYDMVTKSWVKGSVATIASVAKTNFVNDWDGNLVYVRTSGSSVPNQWSDASQASRDMVISTKDIDFGQPGQLKNVYKVYLTYRGDGSNVQVHYGKDGLAPTLTFNTINSDGSSTGSGTLAKSIPVNAGVTDWLKAELKPSAPISNINSFRLKLSGDASAAVAADFEINDITIVYRLKGAR